LRRFEALFGFWLVHANLFDCRNLFIGGWLREVVATGETRLLKKRLIFNNPAVGAAVGWPRGFDYYYFCGHPAVEIGVMRWLRTFVENKLTRHVG
jgi:hypothetical protein